MIPGLVALGGLTRLIQSLLHSRSAQLHHILGAADSHLHGPPLQFLHNVAHSRTLAANIAGAIVIGLSTIYSFVGHKKVTFKTQPAPATDLP